MYINPPSSLSAYVQCRSGRRAYDTITGYVKKAKDEGGEVLIGGSGKSVYFRWLMVILPFFKPMIPRDSLSSPRLFSPRILDLLLCVRKSLGLL